MLYGLMLVAQVSSAIHEEQTLQNSITASLVRSSNPLILRRHSALRQGSSTLVGMR